MRKYFFKKELFVSLLQILFLGVGLVACGEQKSPAHVPGTPYPETKELNIYNWGDYIAPDVIEKFEKETGIKVRYDTFDSNELLQAKLVAGGSGYDIVVPSSPWAGIQIKAGLVQKLDKSLIPNLKNENPIMQQKLAEADPGNDYLVDWALVYDTLGINVDKVKKALGSTPMPANPWDLLFKPEYVSKLSSCGVTVIDSPTDVIPQSLVYLGKDETSANKDDYKQVDALLKSIRPYITRIAASGHIEDLANGAICLAFVYSGDINIARKRALENKTGQNVTAMLPNSETLLLNMDSMEIPVDAKNVKNAMIFINYMLRPEVQATTTNVMLFPTSNEAALKFVNPDLAKEGYVFPTFAQYESMIVEKKPNLMVNRMQTRAYSRFKSNNY